MGGWMDDFEKAYKELVERNKKLEGLLDRISEEIRYLRASRHQDWSDCDEVLYNIEEILKEEAE